MKISTIIVLLLKCVAFINQFHFFSLSISQYLYDTFIFFLFKQFSMFMNLTEIEYQREWQMRHQNKALNMPIINQKRTYIHIYVCLLIVDLLINLLSASESS
jgi:hypothetical protein